MSDILLPIAIKLPSLHDCLMLALCRFSLSRSLVVIFLPSLNLLLFCLSASWLALPCSSSWPIDVGHHYQSSTSASSSSIFSPFLVLLKNNMLIIDMLPQRPFISILRQCRSSTSCVGAGYPPLVSVSMSFIDTVDILLLHIDYFSFYSLVAWLAH
eukprot:Gb_05361 [translate_table: standard]